MTLYKPSSGKEFPLPAAPDEEIGEHMPQATPSEEGAY
jgi:hypothetical protein